MLKRDQIVPAACRVAGETAKTRIRRRGCDGKKKDARESLFIPGRLMIQAQRIQPLRIRRNNLPRGQVSTSLVGSSPFQWLRKKLDLKRARQQAGMFESNAPFYLEIRERFPTMGASVMVATLRQDYSIKVSEYDFLQVLIEFVSSGPITAFPPHVDRGSVYPCSQR
jgi:hypothetical protein